MTVLWVLVILLGVVVVISLLWRYGPSPCPHWLVPLLENRYFEAVAGTSLLLDRSGTTAGMWVLDAGCGPGRLTLPAANRVGESGRVIALDVQPKMLEQLEQRVTEHQFTNVDLLLAGLGEGKLPADTFHVAFLVAVLGEVPDKLTALKEIYDSLKVSGILSVTEALPDPHYQPVARVRRLAQEVGFIEQRYFSGHLSYTINLVKDAGLATSRTTTSGSA